MKNFFNIKTLLITTLLLTLFSCSNNISDNTTKASSFSLQIPLDAIASNTTSRAAAPWDFKIDCILSGSVSKRDSKEVSAAQKAVTFEFDGIPVGQKLIIEIEIYDATGTLLFVGKETCTPAEAGNNVTVNLTTPEAQPIATFINDNAKLLFYADNTFKVQYTQDCGTTFSNYGITELTWTYIKGTYTGNPTTDGSIQLTGTETMTGYTDEEQISLASMSLENAKKTILGWQSRTQALPATMDINDAVITGNVFISSELDMGNFTRE